MSQFLRIYLFKNKKIFHFLIKNGRDIYVVILLNLLTFLLFQE